jgi:hypothetical protein
LLAALAELDLGALNAEEVIEASVALGRVIAYAQSLQLRAFARFARLRPAAGRPFCEFAADELGPALAVSRNSAATSLTLAVQLADRLQGTLAALEVGRIDLPKARVMADVTAAVSDVHAAQVEQRVLAKAGEQTAPQLRRAAARALLTIDPDGAAARHALARKERRVVVYPARDGMAELYALLPAQDATAIYQRLDVEARRAHVPDGEHGDGRTADARRADALVDLLLGKGSAGAGSGGARVHVTVAATTLLGLDERPGELTGYGPIPAALARELAADGTWRRLLTDPATGALRDYGRTTYRPSAALSGHLRARDGTCRFPGCRYPARRCDLDHTVGYPDGPTSEDNLGSLCRHHHRLKHRTGWTVTQGENATFTWTSPTGRLYSTTPDPLAEPVSRPELAAPASDHDPPPF